MNGICVLIYGKLKGVQDIGNYQTFNLVNDLYNKWIILGN